MEPHHYFPGTLPVIISIPHAGVHVPGTILEKFVTSAKQLPDTDWHVDRLYSFAHKLGVHLLVATHSRYVIDLNRSRDGESLYPGKFTTSLCPTTLFDGTPLYQVGLEPNANEQEERINIYWQPYHQKLQAIIASLQGHKRIVVFDAHSIRSQIPTLFPGVLSDLNLGTADGVSTDFALNDKLVKYCRHSKYATVSNGRFKGGYITRHYGNPAQGIHAVQLELAQSNYMQESYPFAYNESKAKQLQITLNGLLEQIIEWVEEVKE